MGDAKHVKVRPEPAWHIEGSSGTGVVRGATPYYNVSCEGCPFSVKGYTNSQPYQRSPVRAARDHFERTQHQVVVRVMSTRIYQTASPARRRLANG